MSHLRALIRHCYQISWAKRVQEDRLPCFTPLLPFFPSLSPPLCRFLKAYTEMFNFETKGVQLKLHCGAGAARDTLANPAPLLLFSFLPLPQSESVQQWYNDVLPHSKPFWDNQRRLMITRPLRLINRIVLMCFTIMEVWFS